MGTDRLDWQYRGDYIRKHDVEPAWADEAFTDPAAVIESPDHASKSGDTDRCIGFSPSADAVLIVIYMREALIGVNAWKANDSYRRRYYNQEER